ncbi:MAG: hypothetical protein QM763_24275 [Agriterribacter sp.]
MKLALARNLLERNFPKSAIRGIFYFIRYYVAFANPENDSKFDSKIDSFTQKNRHMGIVEMIKERETQKILERGIEKGKVEGRIEGKTAVVRNLITKLGLPDAQAAEVAEVPVAFVKKIRASLKKQQ